MTRVLYYYTLISLFFLGTTSCTTEADPQVEADKFVRIFDSNQFNETFRPLDIIETPDNGFLILAEKTIESQEIDRRVYILKTDELGNYVNDYTFTEGFTNPLPSITQINDRYYFFCMDASGLTVLTSTDASLTTVATTPVVLSYPAAVSFAGSDGFLLLSYDQVEKKTVFSKVKTDGTVAISRKFTIADDNSYDDIIMQHFLRTGKQFPFAIGKLPGGLYYFNGFYDYNFSLVTTNLQDDDDVDHAIYGQKDDGAISAIVPLTNNSLAGAYFNFGANYFVPEIILSSDPENIINLGGYHMQELINDAPVQLKVIEASQKSYLAFSTSTKSKQIGIYLYDQSTSALAGVKHIGFSNPFESGNIIQTNDGGLAVCGTTYIAGRFGRIVLVKLPSKDLEAIVD